MLKSVVCLLAHIRVPCAFVLEVVFDSVRGFRQLKSCPSCRRTRNDTVLITECGVVADVLGQVGSVEES